LGPDAGSAGLLGSAQPMIAALSRLGSLHGGGLPDQVKAFGISSDSRMFQLFATHPPIEVRIAALRGAA
jgi:heat shock protein HtpX